MRISDTKSYETDILKSITRLIRLSSRLTLLSPPIGSNYATKRLIDSEFASTLSQLGNEAEVLTNCC